MPPSPPRGQVRRPPLPPTGLGQDPFPCRARLPPAPFCAVSCPGAGSGSRARSGLVMRHCPSSPLGCKAEHSCRRGFLLPQETRRSRNTSLQWTLLHCLIPRSRTAASQRCSCVGSQGGCCGGSGPARVPPPTRVGRAGEEKTGQGGENEALSLARTSRSEFLKAVWASRGNSFLPCMPFHGKVALRHRGRELSTPGRGLGLSLSANTCE